MIELRKVTKSYGSFTAVDSMSLEIAEGEIFGFLGVNGAGKTTTLRMITGILEPDEGDIFIGPYNIKTEPMKAKSIMGYVPDRPYIYPKLTGREYLYFIADLYAVPSKEVNPRIDSLLTHFKLNDWQHELVENYSHGMRQRLATCGALVHDPTVLIFDEPMVGLDPPGAKLLKESLVEYSRQGKTVLLSTHSLNVAEEVCNRLAIVHGGKILWNGTLAELRVVYGTNDTGLEALFMQVTENYTQILET